MTNEIRELQIFRQIVSVLLFASLSFGFLELMGWIRCDGLT